MADIVIKNGTIVTMNEDEQILKNGGLAVEDGRIVDIGDSEKIETDYSADVELDATGKVVLPGFVNTHTHLFQNLLKGRRDDLPLFDWISQVEMPLVRTQFQDALSGDFEVGYYAALLGCVEALKSGTTCLVDMDLRNPLVPEAFKLTGIRGFYAMNLADQWVPQEVLLPREEAMSFFDQIIGKWHGTENGRIQCMFGPSTPYICSKEYLQEIKEQAGKKRMRITIHVSETANERDLIKKETGKLPFDYLDSIGFLGSEVSAVHCVWISNREIGLLQKTGTSVSHNPESNMKLASGVAPVPSMLKRGITVSLGTDGCASNDNMDMLEEMRTAALLHKVANLDASIISSYDVLKMATIEGAKSLGLGEDVGSLETGKKADIILLNIESVHLRPVNDIISTLVYCANAGDVETVMVDGRILVHDHKIKSVDEKRLISKVERKISAQPGI
jgi:5-methylthioadenosine/S-adenosylhomocysteine deaminase